MTAIIMVGGNGLIQEDYSLFDQYGSVLSNVLGINDTAQDALGRLVIPRSTSDPGSPSQGMYNLRTDLGAGGRERMYSAGVWLNRLHMRQFVISPKISSPQIVSGTSYVDITNLSISLTTSGGRLAIYLVAMDDSPNSYQASVFWLNNGAFSSGSGEYAKVVADIDGTNLASVGIFAVVAGSNGASSYGPGSFRWYTAPLAGAHTIKIKATLTIGAGDILGFARGLGLVVEEWDT